MSDGHPTDVRRTSDGRPSDGGLWQGNLEDLCQHETETDVLPRSRVGDMHSPYYAMMSSEVRAASKRIKKANLQSPTMRDSVYEVESPWLGAIY